MTDERTDISYGGVGGSEMSASLAYILLSDEKSEQQLAGHVSQACWRAPSCVLQAVLGRPLTPCCGGCSCL